MQIAWSVASIFLVSEGCVLTLWLAGHLPIDARWRDTSEKKRWAKRTCNVPFDVRPSGKVSFKLGQVGHHGVGFVYQAVMERAKFGVWLCLVPVQLGTRLKEIIIHLREKLKSNPATYSRFWERSKPSGTIRGFLGIINQITWADFNHVTVLKCPFRRCNAFYLFSPPEK